MMTEPKPNDPIGSAEIATILGAKPETVHMWSHRGLLPKPDWTVGGRPAWRWWRIKQWAIQTKRLESETDA